MAKITVTHYLNINLKPYIVNGEKKYNVYVLVRANNQNTKLKSMSSVDEYSEAEYESLLNDPESELSKNVNIETDLFELVVAHIYKDKKTFTPKLFNEYLERYLKPMLKVVERIDIDLGQPVQVVGALKTEAFYDAMKVYINKKRSIDFLERLIADGLSSFKCLFPKNYEIEDFFVGQWLLKDIRKQFDKKVNSLIQIETDNTSTEIKDYIATFDKYINETIK